MALLLLLAAAAMEPYMIRSSYKGGGGGLGPICWTWRAKSSLLFLTAMVLSMMFLMGWEAAPLSILLFGIPARAEDSIPAAAVAASSRGG